MEESTIYSETNRPQQPLIGQTVLVARPRRQAADLIQLLESAGATVVAQPAIEIREPDDWTDADRAIDQLESFDWIVFSSSNGVDAMIGRLTETGHRLDSLRNTQIAAIGLATARRLEELGLHVDLIPETFRAEALADALSPHVDGKRVLLVRASRGREIMTERLTQAGADVCQAVFYMSIDVTEPDPGVVEMLDEGRIDWVAVTSSAIARSLVTMFGESLRRTRLAAISPITADAIRQQGHEPAVTAEKYDMPGLVHAMARDQQ